jgi:hypothetical protein
MNHRLLLLFARVYFFLAVSASCAWATTVVPPKFAELVGGADYIVRARVKSLSSEASERPGKPPLVYTYVALEVVEAIAGEAPAKPILRVLGGKVGDVELRVEGVPRFEVGQEEVFFVRGNGRSFYPLFAAMHGRYAIKRDASGREFVARSNGVQLDDVAEIATPMTEGTGAQLQQQRRSPATALSPAAFIQRVRDQRGGRAPR